MFTNKDQLAHYMISGHVHLSKKDYGFFNNIKTIVHDHKPVTTNQNKLFDKLLLKYQRQLQKLNFNVQTLIELSWKVEVLESKPEYLSAYISIDNDKIIIRSPFNTKFVQMFRKIPLIQFVWNKLSRVYEAPLSTYQLKIAIDAVNKCYETVNYCDQVQKILEEINQYSEVIYWQPTLVKIHDNYYVIASNSALNEVIKDFELNDDPKTFYMLSQYGVTIHPDLINNNYTKFASEYVTEIDSSNLSDLCDWLRNLNVECVFTSRDLVYSKDLSNDLKLLLLERGIICKPATKTDIANSVLLKTHSSWTAFTSTFNKIIHLKNSRPVKIK